MRKLIVTIFITILGFIGFAQPIDSLQKANEYYAIDEIQKAISMYESIIDEGFESAALYFNLGNAYYKNNEAIQAILYYEKAKLLAPNDEDIQFNLDLVNQFAVDKIEPLPRPFFVKWLNSIISIFNSNGWAIFSVVSFVLMLVFALVFVFMRIESFKKIAFTLAIVMLAISITTFVFSNRQNERATEHNFAIIFTPSVTAKASPNESSVDLFVIHEGLKVEIVKTLNSWLEIKLEDGNRGWVKEDILKRI